MGDYADGKPYGGHQAHRLIVQTDMLGKHDTLEDLVEALERDEEREGNSEGTNANDRSVSVNKNRE